MGRRRKVLVLFDVSSPPPEDQDFSYSLRHETWATERDVIRALRALGHEVHTLGLYDDLEFLRKTVKRISPDVVFNLSEALGDRRDMEPKIVKTLERMGVRCTGAPSEALALCKNKRAVKKVLAAAGIAVPASDPARYPMFVKPADADGSDGISRKSVVKNRKAELERIRYIRRKLKQDAMTEAYIPGREIYVSLMGKKKITVFPPREAVFGTAFPVATAAAKWSRPYRKKHGIGSRVPRDLPPALLRQIQTSARKAYERLGVQSYARVDLRITPEEEIFVIEVNPNPMLAEKEDFARSAKAGGVSYKRLIQSILEMTN